MALLKVRARTASYTIREIISEGRGVVGIVKHMISATRVAAELRAAIFEVELRICFDNI